jgi:hypothetical protein
MSLLVPIVAEFRLGFNPWNDAARIMNVIHETIRVLHILTATGCVRRKSIHGNGQLMPHIGSANPEDYIGSDIGGMIGYPLQVLRNQDAVHGLLGVLGLLFDEYQ